MPTGATCMGVLLWHTVTVSSCCICMHFHLAQRCMRRAFFGQSLGTSVHACMRRRLRTRPLDPAGLGMALRAGAGGSCRAAAEAAERHGGAARREQLAPRHWRARHRQDPGRVCTPCVRAVHCRGGCLMCHWTIMTWHSPATSRHAATVRMKACMRASRGWTDPSVG